MTLKRLIFLILGCLCLGLSCVGIVLPILPTVPFFLATVFCFANSSENLHNWFQGTKLYKNHLDSFVKKKRRDRIHQGGHSLVGDAAHGRGLFPDVTEGADGPLHHSRRGVVVPSGVLPLWRENAEGGGSRCRRRAGGAAGVLRPLAGTVQLNMKR